MKLMSLMIALSLLGAACSSKKKVKDIDNTATISRDFEVKDASSTTRPGWIEDASVWVEQENMDVMKYRYFSFETEPKVNREIACNLAKANVRADIASEITTFIQNLSRLQKKALRPSILTILKPWRCVNSSLTLLLKEFSR